MVRQQLVHWRFVGAIASTAGQLVARKTPRARRSVSGEPQCGPQLEVEAALKPPELEDLAGEPAEVPRGDLLAALLGDHVHRLAGELLPAVYGPVVLCEPEQRIARLCDGPHHAAHQGVEVAVVVPIPSLGRTCRTGAPSPGTVRSASLSRRGRSCAAPRPRAWLPPLAAVAPSSAERWPYGEGSRRDSRRATGEA